MLGCCGCNYPGYLTTADVDDLRGTCHQKSSGLKLSRTTYYDPNEVLRPGHHVSVSAPFKESSPDTNLRGLWNGSLYDLYEIRAQVLGHQFGDDLVRAWRSLRGLDNCRTAGSKHATL